MGFIVNQRIAKWKEGKKVERAARPFKRKEWKDGRMEGWKDGRMEGKERKNGRMEEGKDGRMEG